MTAKRNDRVAFVGRFAAACAAYALLAGCAESPPFVGNPLRQQLGARSNASVMVPPHTTSYLYVANDVFGHGDPGGEVDILLRNDPGKGVVDRITKGVSGPDGIFVDSHGTLYVTNGNESGYHSVEAYKLGAHEPFREYVGAFCPFYVIAADDGTVYIADACGGSSTEGRVLVYPPGQSKPARSIYPDGPPYALTLDTKNNLYVGYNIARTGIFVGQVERFAPGASHGVKLLPDNTVFFLASLAVDSHGALLVSSETGGAIDVFTAKDRPPSRIIKTGQAHPFMFTFDQSEDTIYVSDVCMGGGGSAVPLSSSGCPGPRPNTVVALDYATGRRLWTVREQTFPHVGWLPLGVAVYPKAPF
jgi:hypothetical protein